MQAYRVIISVLILSLTGCNSNTKESIGCIWELPSNAIERSDGSIVVSDNAGEESYYLYFYEEALTTLEGTDEGAFNFVSSSQSGMLSVKEYVSTDKTPIAGIKYYLLTRPGIEGTVTVINHDFNNLLKLCKNEPN